MDVETRFLVLGSGIAGLSFALRVAEHGPVIVVTKKGTAESATNYAQGGIAAVIDSADSLESHVEDTLRAGARLCDEAVVRFVIEHGPGAVRSLIDLGVRFDPSDRGSGYDLGREGGHSHRRVLHAADFTGQEIERVLVQRCEEHPNIRLLANAIAVDLVTTRKLGLPNSSRVLGAYILDEDTGEVSTFRAPIVMLATGGCGKVYVYTSNPDIASGDGVAMGYRAGASIANMEFYQFHPTCLYHPEARSFLISEAVRGEDGVLRNETGERFMPRYDERADLAPRDIVARAIDFELKRRGDDCVYLDCTAMDPQFIRSRFPNISERCAQYGFDMAKQPLPVVPAAHYACGGVRTDLCGETDIRNLFAAARSRAQDCMGQTAWRRTPCSRAWCSRESPPREAIARTTAELEHSPPAPLGSRPRERSHRSRARGRQLGRDTTDDVELRGHRAQQQAPGARPAPNRAAAARDPRVLLGLQADARTVELRNLATVAEVIVESALARKRPGGCTTPSTTRRRRRSPAIRSSDAPSARPSDLIHKRKVALPAERCELRFTRPRRHASGRAVGGGARNRELLRGPSVSESASSARASPRGGSRWPPPPRDREPADGLRDRSLR